LSRKLPGPQGGLNKNELKYQEYDSVLFKTCHSKFIEE